MIIERTLAVYNRTYSFELTNEELERAHDEYIAIYGNDPLLDYIKQEVPYRLQEVLGCKPEQITRGLVEEFVKALYDNSDVMFDYDRLDKWLAERFDRTRAKDNSGTCEVCKWHEPFSGACCNGDSPDCADFVDWSHGCNAWEAKDSLS